MQMRCKWASH